MTTARSQRQRELAMEIERRLRRQRTRQICFVVAGAAFLCAFFIFGRAFMPMVPTQQPADKGDEAAAETPVSETPIEQANAEPEPQEPSATETPSSDGGVSLSFLIASAALAATGGIALGIARLLKSEDDEPGEAE